MRLTRNATRNPPPTATTSSRIAPGRSCPPLRADPDAAAPRRRHSAEHGTDHSGAEGAERVEEGAADDRTREGAHDEPGDELWRCLATGRLRQLVGDQFHQQEKRQDGDGDRVSHPLRPLVGDVDPAKKRTPGHHRGSCQRPQAGDHADQQCEQQDKGMCHANLRTGGNDTRTLTRTACAKRGIRSGRTGCRRPGLPSHRSPRFRP